MGSSDSLKQRFPPTKRQKAEVGTPSAERLRTSESVRVTSCNDKAGITPSRRSRNPTQDIDGPRRIQERSRTQCGRRTGTKTGPALLARANSFEHLRCTAVDQRRLRCRRLRQRRAPLREPHEVNRGLPKRPRGATPWWSTAKSQRFEKSLFEGLLRCPKSMAEREGFEPPIGLHLCRISSAVHSTTLPPLQGAKSGAFPRWSGPCSRRG